MTSGFTELEKLLLDLEPSVSKRVSVAAMKKALKPVLKETQAEAPEKTGGMKRAIKIRVGRSKSKFVKRVMVSLSKKFYTGKEFFAAFLEFGHKAGSRKLGDSRTEVPGEHFVENSWNETKDGVLESLGQTLGEQIEKHAEKMRRK